MKKLLVLALLAALLVTVRAAPDAAAAGKKAALATTYTCDSALGSGSAKVRVSTRLPRAVKAGTPVAKRRIKVSLVLPEDLVDAMRAFGVRAIEGEAAKTPMRVGKKRVPVRKLGIPRTQVPASGAMRLVGKGRLSRFTAPGPGTYAVRVPKRLNASLTAYFDGSQTDASLTCAVAGGAPTRLSTLRVRA